MLASIIGAISGIAGLLALAMKWMQQRHDEYVGAALQTASQTAVALSTQAEMTRAIVDAPRTQSAVVASLNSGAF